MAFSVNSGSIGVDLNNTSTTQLFSLGSMVRGSDGSIWQYVCASSTCTAYSVVIVNSSGTCKTAVLGDTNAGQGPQLAVVQNTFAASEYGWVPIHGGAGLAGFRVNVSASVTLGVTLYLATSSGHLSSTAAASATVNGIVLSSASAVAGITNYPCILTWPKFNTLGT